MIGGLVPPAWHGMERIGVAVVYLLLAVVILVRNRRVVPALLRDGFLTAARGAALGQLRMPASRMRVISSSA